MSPGEQQTLFESTAGRKEAGLKPSETPPAPKSHLHAFVGDICWYPGCKAKNPRGRR